MVNKWLRKCHNLHFKYFAKCLASGYEREALRHEFPTHLCHSIQSQINFEIQILPAINNKRRIKELKSLPPWYDSVRFTQPRLKWCWVAKPFCKKFFDIPPLACKFVHNCPESTVDLGQLHDYVNGDPTKEFFSEVMAVSLSKKHTFKSRQIVICRNFRHALNTQELMHLYTWIHPCSDISLHNEIKFRHAPLHLYHGEMLWSYVIRLLRIRIGRVKCLPQSEWLRDAKKCSRCNYMSSVAQNAKV